MHAAQHKYTTSQEKCLLKVEDNRLFRLVELVRINLHFRTDEATALAGARAVQWVSKAFAHNSVPKELET